MLAGVEEAQYDDHWTIHPVDHNIGEPVDRCLVVGAVHALETSRVRGDVPQTTLHFEQEPVAQSLTA